MKATLLRSGAIYGLGNVLAAGVPFLLLPILTRALPPSDFGMVISFFLLVTLSNSLAGLSVHGAVSVKWFQPRGRDFSRFVGTALLLAVGSSLVCGLILLACAFVFPDRLDMLPRFWFLAAIHNGATIVVGMRSALWQSQGQALRASTLQVGTAALNVALSLLGVFVFALGGEGRIYGSIVASVVSAAAATWLLFNARDARWAVARSDLTELLRFGVPLIPHALAGALLVTTDRFSVSGIMGSDALGIYGIAAQIGTTINVLADALTKTTSPWMFAQMSAGTVRARLRVVGAAYALVPVWLLVAFGLWLVFRLAGSLILGARYVPAIDLSIWFLLGGAASAMYLNISGLYFFTSKTEWLSLATLSAAAFSLVSAPVLVGEYGLMGGGLSFLAVQIFFLLVCWILSFRIQLMPWHRPGLALRLLGRRVKQSLGQSTVSPS